MASNQKTKKLKMKLPLAHSPSSEDSEEVERVVISTQERGA